MGSRLASLALLAAACAHAPVAIAPAFDVRAGPGDEAAARRVERLLPAARTAAERWGRLDAPVTVVIHGSNEELTATAGRPGASWLRAWARPGRIDLQSPRTWTRGRDDDASLAALLAHELTHCLLFQRMGTGWTRRDVPRWFEEGMASYTAGERHDRVDASLALDFAASDPRRAYGAADRAFRLLVRSHGEEGVRRVLDGLAAGLPFASAFDAATGTPVAAFEESLRGGAIAARGGITASSRSP